MTISLHCVLKQNGYGLILDLSKGILVQSRKTFNDHTFHNLDHHVPKPGLHVSKKLLLRSDSL